MELYEVIFDPKKDKGIYALSVVNDPAMESMFIALNKDEKPVEAEIKLAEVNKEQRILMGVALIPDKPIYRNQDGKEFYITFPKETIKSAAHSFLQNQYNNNSSLEHEVKLNGMAVVESWMVDNPELDKSKHYGLEAPEGSWVAAMKVEDDTVWNEYVKTGKIKGFSIDGLFSLNKLELNNEQPMSDNKSIMAELKQGFADLKALFSKEETKVELASAKLADGETILEYEGEELKPGTAVFIGGEPAPDGVHELEDGRKITVAEGVVSEVSIEVDEDASMEEIQEALTKLKETFKSLETEMKAAKEGFETELAKKDGEIEDLKTQLSATPATKPIKHKSVELSTDKPKNRTERLKLALQKNK
jgi:hypothetical protein